MARGIDRALRGAILAMVAIALAYMMERALVEEPESTTELTRMEGVKRW